MTKKPRARSERTPVNNRVLRLEAVCEKTGYRKTMLHEVRRDDPRFPKPVKLGKRAIGFFESEIDQYLTLVAKERAS